MSYRASHLRETLLDGLPVDDLPDGLEVFGLAVLVLEAEKNVSKQLSELPHSDSY